MITQIWLNGFVDIVVIFIGMIPPLPPEWASMLAQVGDSGAYLGSMLAKFGIIIPWQTAASLLLIWVQLVLWAGGIALIRLVLWAFGR